MTSKNKNILITVIAAAIIIVPAIGLSLINGTDTANLPVEFVEGRSAAAQASENISDMLNDSLESLSLIARYERSGQVADAQELLQQEQAKSAERNAAAIELATAIDRMAQNTNKIDQEDARELAVQAVSSQVAAITHILSFNHFFDRLNEQIKRKLDGEDPASLTIESTLNQLNEEVEDINKLNKEFTKSLKEFDKALQIN